ncbi:MAG: NUDIX domain-containing protein [Alphaproteobacteria bacterium TMED89]|nr:MAG: NUDIX domain-containing protein [Alphaproteobacteria bacterium TMED89]
MSIDRRAKITRVSIAAILRPPHPSGTKGTAVLATWRPKELIRGGVWELPGGKINPGETAAEAAVREVREELDIDIRAGDSIGIAEDLDEDLKRERHVHVEAVMATLVGDEPLDGERAWRWIPIDRLHEFEWPRANRTLNRMLQARFNVEPNEESD